MSPKRRKFHAGISQGALSTLILLAAAMPPTLIARPVLAQVGGPREATITSLRDKVLTLSVGSEDGARPGAVYVARSNGTERARLQIIDVRRTESTARLLSIQEEFVLPVGSTVSFVEIAPLAPDVVVVPQPAPVAPPNPVIVSPPAPVVTPAPVNPLPPQPPRPVMRPVAANSTAPIALTAVEGMTAMINAGSSRGVKAGSTLPILRDGNVIALVRVQAVNPNDASGTVVWRDEAVPALRAGDMVGMVGGGAPAMQIGPGVPAAAIPYETGASNIGVPTADRDYLYLAGLAAQGLITSQPAHVFNDEGSRRHRTAEDYTFTRAQIAGFVREALSSPKAENPKEKTRVALGELISEYGKELRQLGVADETLSAFARSNGFEFGVSGQQRATLTGGDDIAGFLLPFSERQGGPRTRSGFDTRTNLWARSGKLSFLGSVDTGSDPIRGVNSRSFSVRRALLSYDADKLLRGLKIEAGRDEVWMGPGHFGTLVLGDTAGPLNMLKTTFKRGSYAIESLYAPLGTGPGGSKRSLYTKNTYVNIGSQSRIGFIESVLEPTQTVDPTLFIASFTPVPLFLADRLQGGRDTTNYNASAYIESSVARGVRGYGEFLIDDIGVNNRNRVRNRFGTLIGAHIYTPKDPTKLGLYGEYSNLQGRTYLDLLGDPDYNYYYRGAPLGHPVAPPFANFGAGRGIGGAESLRIEGYWRALPKLRFYSGVEVADLNSEVVVTPPTVPAPGFGLSRQQIIRLRVSYDLSRRLTLTGRFLRVNTSQPNFILREPTSKQNLFSVEIARAF
jgi:hypothetical protein